MKEKVKATSSLDLSKEFVDMVDIWDEGYFAGIRGLMSFIMSMASDPFTKSQDVSVWIIIASKAKWFTYNEWINISNDDISDKIITRKKDDNGFPHSVSMNTVMLSASLKRLEDLGYIRRETTYNNKLKRSSRKIFPFIKFNKKKGKL